MEGLPENLPDLEEPFPICLLTKKTKIIIYPTTDVSNFAPGFMLHMNFAFFNVEGILGFTSTFVAICSITSHPFGITYRSDYPPLEIFKFIVTTLRNQDKKVAFFRVDEYGALAISSEFMNTCHDMNTIVQTTCGDESSINGKSESPNKTLDHIKKYFILNLSNKKKNLLLFL